MLNLYLWMMAASFAEILSFMAKADVDPGKAIDIWKTTVFNNYVIENKSEKVLKADFKRHFTVDLTLKDIQLAMEIAEELGFPTPIASTVRDLFTECKAMGLSELDYISIVKLYESIWGVKVAGTKS
ncbi:MAG: NAD-binding protein [Aigarchaeota archaeon]|nr:NAD-binding protein [Candidatus Pelearchaeum maunauluense]